jgi:D-tyrosyl-tRNA(Tyr) deacylase
MKVVIQRVTQASVGVDAEVVGEIGQGLVVFVGVAQGDTIEDISYLVEKTINLRIFADAEGKFNLSAIDVKGELLLVSQFTLLASTRKGRRPGFTDAAPPEQAEALFNQFAEQARASGLKVATGKFQAHMLVEIHNDGPVTILIDSRERLESRH